MYQLCKQKNKIDYQQKTNRESMKHLRKSKNNGGWGNRKGNNYTVSKKSMM
jgi:hypothetical protein